MANDKRTIGVTGPNEKVLDNMVASGQFASELDAAKFAFAVAVKGNIDPGTTDGASTKWNVGTLDPDQSLRHVVEALFADVDEPYRLVEYLMNRGLSMLSGSTDTPPNVYQELFGSGDN